MVSRRFVRMDVLSGRCFVRTALDVLSGRTCLRRFVRKTFCQDWLRRFVRKMFSQDRNTLFEQYFCATWAILVQQFRATLTIFERYLGILGRYLRTTFGNYLNNTLAILRDKLVTTWALLGHYLIDAIPFHSLVTKVCSLVVVSLVSYV